MLLLEAPRVLLRKYSGRENFSKLVCSVYGHNTFDTERIMLAYEIVDRDFCHDIRASRERYIRHLEAVAIFVILVMQRLSMRDGDVVVAALLHDILEDKSHLWTKQKLQKLFGVRVVLLVWWVSEDPLATFSRWSLHGRKGAQSAAFKKKLLIAPFRAILIKLGDRLHNLITLWAKKRKSQHKKVRETKHLYYKLSTKYNNVLLEDLTRAVREVEMSWGH